MERNTERPVKAKRSQKAFLESTMSNCSIRMKEPNDLYVLFAVADVGDISMVTQSVERDGCTGHPHRQLLHEHHLSGRQA